MLSALLLWEGCGQEGDAPPPGAARSEPPGGLNLYNRLGEQHLNSGKYSLALKAFQEALEGAEDSARAYTGMGRTYLAQEEFTLAEDALSQAASLDTTRGEVSYAFAELFLKRYLKTYQVPLLQRALVAARQATRRAPDQKAYFYLLGNLYDHSGKADSAEAAYLQALALDPGLAAAYEQLGSLYRFQGRFAEAEKLYQKQLEQQPENAQAFCELALLYRADGRLSEARELLEKAVRLDTGLAAAHLNLGQLYLAEGQTEAGKKALERFQEFNENDTADLLTAAEARPWDAKAQLKLADAYVEDRTFPDEAERLYLKALQLDSNLIAAYTGLGRLYLLQQRLKEAADILQQAWERSPSTAEVHTDLGEVYLLQNRSDLAVQTLKKSTELDASSPRAYELLASAYRQSGQYQKEQQARERARELRERGSP